MLEEYNISADDASTYGSVAGSSITASYSLGYMSEVYVKATAEGDATPIYEVNAGSSGYNRSWYLSAGDNYDYCYFDIDENFTIDLSGSSGTDADYRDLNMTASVVADIAEGKVFYVAAEFDDSAISDATITIQGGVQWFMKTSMLSIRTT